MLGEGALQRTGEPGSYRVVCPFHDDRNPSLNVSDEKKVYYCFGCQASGNLFSLEKRWHGLDTVPQAVASLATRYPRVAEIVAEQGNRSGSPDASYEPPSAGAAFPAAPPQWRAPREPESRAWGDTLNARRELTRILSVARKHFVDALAQSAEAQAYLAGRGVSPEAIERFDFGYAPGADMTGCLQVLAREGFDEDACVRAGVAKRDRSGRVYDVFRDRVMLPIRDVDGNVVSFAGRLLGDSETAPKYINGASSAVFQKKESLFGADLVVKAVESSARLEYGTVVLVEGYMDVVALHDKSDGKVACVASMGTAVSPEQILAALELLGDRVDGKLIINLDGDDAGEAAAVRLCESVLPTMTGVSCVYIAQPPEHVKDVGEFLDGGDESATAEAYVKFLEEAAAPWLEWRVMRIIQQVLDARAKVETAVQVAQAAELGAMGDGDDDEDAYGPGGGVSQTSSLSEQMRQESLMFLDSMSGVSGSGDGGEEAAGDAQDSSEGRARRDENVRALSAKERQQRRAASLASTRASQDGENAEGDDASIGGCPVAVLDELGVFMSKALRGSPGVNVPWLVHRWADTLSGGSTKRVPLLYDAVMSHIVRHMSKWESTSPAHMIDLMPPPPWVIEELPKARQAKMMRSTGSAQEGKPMDIDVFMGDSRRRKESHKRMQLQETFLIPHVERRQSPASRQLRSKPRAAAEEIVLRAILWADANDRLDALEALLAVMIRVEEAGLFPFWTSASRAALFEYLVDVDGVMAVDEMAAECEQKEWWKVEVEMLFVPVDEFGDEELKSVRQLELMEPVLTVSQAATAVEEMARKVASGRAVDKLGDYMQAQLGDGDTDGAQVEPDQVRGMVDAISGLAFKSAAERKELDEAAIARDAEWEEERKMKILEDKLVRGELVPLDSRDSALAGDGGDAAVDEADAR